MECREAFEAWADHEAGLCIANQTEGCPCCGEYLFDDTNAAWEAWKSAWYHPRSGEND